MRTHEVDPYRRGLLAAISGLMVGNPRAKAIPAVLGDYEHQSGGRVGVYAENLGTGARFEWRAEERFVMCSTFKASLAAFVLARADRHEENLGDRISYGSQDLLDYAPVAREHLAEGSLSVVDMCQAIVEVSDNTCANLLLARVGGPSALTAFWRSTGDTFTRLDDYEPEMNRSPPGDARNTTTPAAMANTLRRLTLGEVLSPPARDRLVDWMLNCKTGSNRLRGGLPRGWKIADKTGNNGRDAAGDIAVVWSSAGAPRLISVYTQGGLPTDGLLTATFAEIGRTVEGI